MRIGEGQKQLSVTATPGLHAARTIRSVSSAEMGCLSQLKRFSGHEPEAHEALRPSQEVDVRQQALPWQSPFAEAPHTPQSPFAAARPREAVSVGRDSPSSGSDSVGSASSSGAGLPGAQVADTAPTADPADQVRLNTTSNSAAAAVLLQAYSMINVPVWLCIVTLPVYELPQQRDHLRRLVHVHLRLHALDRGHLPVLSCCEGQSEL